MTILGILLVWLVCGFVFGFVIWDDRRTIDARTPTIRTVTAPVRWRGAWTGYADQIRMTSEAEFQRAYLWQFPPDINREITRVRTAIAKWEARDAEMRRRMIGDTTSE